MRQPHSVFAALAKTYAPHFDTKKPMSIIKMKKEMHPPPLSGSMVTL